MPRRQAAESIVPLKAHKRLFSVCFSPVVHRIDQALKEASKECMKLFQDKQLVLRKFLRDSLAKIIMISRIRISGEVLFYKQDQFVLPDILNILLKWVGRQ